METQHRCFPVEFTKFLRAPILKNSCERLLLKSVLSPGLPFLITYTLGSNWYLCFIFCIIIYIFVCQFSLHYYWYCYNQKQCSGDILQKKFNKFLIIPFLENPSDGCFCINTHSVYWPTATLRLFKNDIRHIFPCVFSA